MQIKDVIISFLKIGTIGFGGGSALIPVVEKEIAKNREWVSADNYNNATIISNITPGALPVKLGSLWSQKYSVISAFSVALPGVFMLIVLLTAFSFIGENAVKYIEFASVGISAFIILLLYLYIIKVHKEVQTSEAKLLYLALTTVAFLLTGGKEIREILAMFLGVSYSYLPAPLFDISTLNLMIISFFSIVFIGSSNSKVRALIAMAVSTVYALTKGKMGIMGEYSYVIIAVMIVCVIVAIVMDRDKSKTSGCVKTDLTPIKNIAVFIAIPIMIGVPCFLLSGNLSTFAKYAVNIALSSATSFGGGEAFVSVADGFFVQTGMLEPQLYYGRIVAAANALPGPILVKIASAIGYEVGLKAGGIHYGLLLALFGFTVSVGISSIAALIIYICFDKLKDNPLLFQIKRYILPVICGMLISTILSMLYECLKIMTNLCSIPPYYGVLIILFMFFAALFLHKKFNVSDLILLLLCGGGTLLMFGVLVNI